MKTAKCVDSRLGGEEAKHVGQRNDRLLSHNGRNGSRIDLTWLEAPEDPRAYCLEIAWPIFAGTIGANERLRAMLRGRNLI